ncbi:ADP-ribosylglycohydrolase family protein [Paenibacillus eucommiae]|uniref:ADP-ribosylglycohydrolase n=1 Tax=Paenibacillus eucommiae TaxID=1355755 RepID=A0ABS4IMT7_9BACL|nr:ADP-ribosylglycohydrolase family protein [Paenibacillus eucommiae]MBP1988849.1 ADP-ribosylglycohydrolase [Paenibacillus eucommiae]
MQNKSENQLTLYEQEYYTKVYGGWLGKNIGGTLGAPLEGQMSLLDLTFYSSLPDGPLENDDLDLQLVWLHALEQYGARLTAKELGQEWMEHIFFPFDEYGYALTNLRRGLVAPVAGWFNNPFTNCMGSPIRSEIWAMVAPGAPGVAAYYAYQDAIVDHAGGEGVYGEMFFAAIQSAAFVESDRGRLIDIGLSYIPEQCRTAQAVKDLLRWHEEGKDWIEARELILKHHGHDNFTDAPQNIAFTILGWLYGEDFGDAILKAVNCGYDTDCTGATLGAILGIIGGAACLPGKWVEPVGDRIVVSPPIKGFPAPANLDELTLRTMKAAREVLAVWDTGVAIEPGNGAAVGSCSQSYDPRYLWRLSVTENRYLLPQGSISKDGLELAIDYGQEGPSIGKQASRTLGIQLTNHSQEKWTGRLSLTLPAGWSGPEGQLFELLPGAVLGWSPEISSDNRVQPAYKLSLSVERLHNGFIWNREEVSFSLVASTHWTLAGPGGEEEPVICPGNRIAFERLTSLEESGERLAASMDRGDRADRGEQHENGGVYRASARLVVPTERDLRLIVATASPVKVSLNGTVLCDDPNVTQFMPAYHRAPASKAAELRIPAGEHQLVIEVTKLKDLPLEVYVLPVANGTQIVPGSFYYYTDVWFA